jgi:hypothetical protein
MGKSLLQAQIERLHDRITYLEAAVTDFYDFLHRRQDAAIVEEVPEMVQAAREQDGRSLGTYKR